MQQVATSLSRVRLHFVTAAIAAVFLRVLQTFACLGNDAITYMYLT